MFLYLQVLRMKYYHNVYTLVASAPVLRFIFVPAVVFIWTGVLNGQRNLQEWFSQVSVKSIQFVLHWKFQNQYIFRLLQFNIQHTAIFTLLYLSGVLFNIVIILTTCHTFLEKFVIPPTFKRTIRSIASTILIRVCNVISYTVTVYRHW